MGIEDIPEPVLSQSAPLLTPGERILTRRECLQLPTGIITTSRPLSQLDAERIKQGFEQAAGKVVVLGDGLTYTPLQATPTRCAYCGRRDTGHARCEGCGAPL